MLYHSPRHDLAETYEIIGLWKHQMGWAGEEAKHFLVFMMCFKISLSMPVPRVSLVCFAFQSAHKSLLQAQLACGNKNDPKLFQELFGDCSTFDGYIGAGIQEEEDYNQWGKINSR